MHVDLTPGIEMYHNFSRDPQATRDFFLRYQERILFGTDIGAKALLASPDWASKRMRAARASDRAQVSGEGRGVQPGSEDGFLFGKFAGQFHGIALPEDALRKIYAGNFERLAGTQPKALNPRQSWPNANA